MPTFASFDGTELWFDDVDDAGGAPVVLLHGLAADTNINYVRAGILDALVDEGFRAVPLDFRGHGLSEKPHDPDAYGDQALTRDVGALLDHLGLDSVAVVGYSMGAGIALAVGATDPRVRAVVALGVGGDSLARRAHGADDGSEFANAFLADDPDSIADPLGRQFRRLADSIRSDRLALAACVRARSADPAEHLADIAVPVLVIAGANDELAGDPGDLAARIPGARAVTVPGNHFDANAHPTLHRAVLEFLTRG